MRKVVAGKFDPAVMSCNCCMYFRTVNLQQACTRVAVYSQTLTAALRNSSEIHADLFRNPSSISRYHQ